MPTLLIVDPTDGDAMRTLLVEHGHDVWLANSVAEALVSLPKLLPELVILDHAIDPSGWLLLPKLGRTLAIVCSAQQSSRDRVTSLRLGADDFVGKPFEELELLARVVAVLRRGPPKLPQRTIHVGDLSIDLGAVRVLVRQRTVPVTPIEFRLLQLLASGPDRLFTIAEIATTLLGTSEEDSSVQSIHAIQTHLYRVRRKLRAAGLTSPRVVNMRNVGYRLSVQPDAIPHEGEPS